MPSPILPGCPCGHHCPCLTCLLKGVPCHPGPEPALGCLRCTEGGGVCEWPRCDIHITAAQILSGIRRDTDTKKEWVDSAIRTLYVAVIDCSDCRKIFSLRRRHETHTASVPGVQRAAWSNLTSATGDDAPDMTCTCCILKRAINGPDSATCHPKTVRERRENDACEFGICACVSCMEDGNHCLVPVCKTHRERVRRWATAQLNKEIPPEAARHYARSLDYEIRGCLECVKINAYITGKGFTFFRSKELGAQVASFMGADIDNSKEMSKLLRGGVPHTALPGLMWALMKSDIPQGVDPMVIMATRYSHLF